MGALPPPRRRPSKQVQGRTALLQAGSGSSGSRALESKSLEEAAANLGATPASVLAWVTAPLLAPAVFGALVYSFVRAVTAVSAVIFVASAS
jgi:ABC-type Fe3+ transport system permease subunit